MFPAAEFDIGASAGVSEVTAPTTDEFHGKLLNGGVFTISARAQPGRS